MSWTVPALVRAHVGRLTEEDDSISDKAVNDAIKKAEDQISARLRDDYSKSGYEVGGHADIAYGERTLHDGDPGVFAGHDLVGRLLFLDYGAEVLTIISSTDMSVTLDDKLKSPTGSYAYQIKHTDLVTGATLLAVSILRTSDDTHDREVSEMYSEAAWITLIPFLVPNSGATGPSFPDDI